MHPELSGLAQRSTVWSHAERLAAWVGAGKPVTGKDVLRPVDARSAARELGITLPRHVRSAADVRAIHHPWCVAQAAGMLVIDASQATAAMTYVYDFGDWWEHQITLEKILDPKNGFTYPTCTAGQGDAPVEDWTPEFPTDPTPFDRADINRRLKRLSTRMPAP